MNNNILNTNSIATAIDGNDGNETSTLTLLQMWHQCLATAQLSGRDDTALSNRFNPRIGINETDINLIGMDSWNQILIRQLILNLLIWESNDEKIHR